MSVACQSVSQSFEWWLGISSQQVENMIRPYSEIILTIFVAVDSRAFIVLFWHGNRNNPGNTLLPALISSVWGKYVYAGNSTWRRLQFTIQLKLTQVGARTFEKVKWIIEMKHKQDLFLFFIE